MASFFDWQLDRSSDLLQNCDLPPPLKLFSPFDKDDKRSQPKTAAAQWDDEPAAAPNSSAAENTSLRRALQLSQSRAREAEKKAAAAKADREQLGTLLLEESLRLSAHRQWVSLLEVEVAALKNKKRRKLDGGGDRDDGGRDDAALTWCLTLALCLGIGFALGRYMF